ncbi:MAG: thiamine pyrophosphate-dependent enzyme, partial [Bellilinea sp.]
QALIIDSARFGPHSKSDDTRPIEMIEELRRTRDPLTIHGNRLAAIDRETVDAEVEALVRAAFEQALSDPPAGGAL